MLVKIILALRALHLGFHARFDFFLDLQHAHFALHQAVDLLQARAYVQRLKKLLLLIHLNAEMSCDEVCQFFWFLGFAHSGQSFFWDVLTHFGIALEFVADGAQERFDRSLIAQLFVQRLGTGFKKLRVVKIARYADPRDPFDKHFYCPIGKLEELQHIGQHAHLVNAVCIRVILARINLRREQDLLAVIHNLFQRANRFFTAHKKRHDHVGENHNVAQRQYWVGGVQFFCHALVLFSGKASHPSSEAASKPSAFKSVNLGVARTHFNTNSRLRCLSARQSARLKCYGFATDFAQTALWQEKSGPHWSIIGDLQ